MNICEFCGINTESLRVPEFRNHACNCISIYIEGSKYKQRIAWGICCAKYVVGVSLMKEEDYHDGAPWAIAEDCTCERKL